MPINDDKVRELLARGESSTLDFKTTDYDWSPTAKKDSNAELAKDLMAMANVLRPGSDPAYIITGVTKTIPHTIVGVSPSSHLDDAALHQKVQGRLNQTPHFSYYPVTVDGLSVGVYEILPGGRPYFALKTAPPSLTRHVSAYRNGSSTDEASPAIILQWAREDDPDAHRLRSLELREREADAKVHGDLRHLKVNTQNDVSIMLVVTNHGRRGFWLKSCDWRCEWNHNFAEQLTQCKVTLPPDYETPRGPVLITHKLIVQPNTKAEIHFVYRREDGVKHVAALGVPGFIGSWMRCHFEVHCDGELGGSDVLSWTVNC